MVNMHVFIIWSLPYRSDLIAALITRVIENSNTRDMARLGSCQRSARDDIVASARLFLRTTRLNQCIWPHSWATKRAWRISFARSTVPARNSTKKRQSRQSLSLRPRRWPSSVLWATFRLPRVYEPLRPCSLSIWARTVDVDFTRTGISPYLYILLLRFIFSPGRQISLTQIYFISLN